MRPPFPEMLLQLMWHRKSIPLQLTGTKGEKIEVVNGGYWNQDAGPDFIQSSIRINGVVWCGQTEFHLLSSDWYRHGHDADPAYFNVVLHVVWKMDRKVVLGGMELVTVELENIIPQATIEKFKDLNECPLKLPCQQFEVTPLHWLQQFDRMAAERHSAKVGEVREKCKAKSWDERQAYWFVVCRFFGGYINKEGMAFLGEQLSWVWLMRLRNGQVRILLLGMTRQLQDEAEKVEFQIMCQHLSLVVPNLGMWKKGKTRPANQIKNRIEELIRFVEFWKLKQFECSFISEKEWLIILKKQRVSKEFMNNYLLNVWGVFSELATPGAGLPIWESANWESNRFTRVFESKILPASKNGLRSQGMYHLWNEYCKHKKCLNCGIGQTIVAG